MFGKNNFSNNENEEDTFSQSANDYDDRIVYLSGDMTECSVSNIIQQIFSLSKRSPVKPIHLVISSYGGEIYEMLSLYDVLKFTPCPIHTVGLGKIMSASVLMLASGEKGNRLIGANARVMIHPVYCDISGNVFEQQNEIKELKNLQEKSELLLAEECATEIKNIKKIMSKGYDFHLSAEEAIKIGIADRIMGK